MKDTDFDRLDITGNAAREGIGDVSKAETGDAKTGAGDGVIIGIGEGAKAGIGGGALFGGEPEDSWLVTKKNSFTEPVLFWKGKTC